MNVLDCVTSVTLSRENKQLREGDDERLKMMVKKKNRENPSFKHAKKLLPSMNEMPSSQAGANFHLKSFD